MKKPDNTAWAVIDKDGYIPATCVNKRRSGVVALLKLEGMRREGDRIIKIKLVPIASTRKK